MKDLFTVIKFTAKEMVFRKSFLISTLIILLLIVVGFNIPNIIETAQDGSKEPLLLIVDNENIFEGQLELLKQADLGYVIEVGTASIEQIHQMIENAEINSAILIEKQENNIKARYIVENTMFIDSVPEEIIGAINRLYTNIQIGKLGLTEEQTQMITPNFEFTLEQTEEEASGNIPAMMIMSIVLFYAIYFCAYQASSSITTEKTSKIMETLVTSTNPKTIVLGKTIGIGIVGLCQMIIIVGVALISAKLFLDPELISSILDLSNITPYLGIITIIYFVLGYFTYSLLYALTGSLVSKPEDIQSANTPVSILTMVRIFFSLFYNDESI